MKDWESEIRNVNAREDAVNRRAIAEYERRRKSRNQLMLFCAILILLMGVTLAVVFLSVFHGSGDDPNKESEPLQTPGNKNPPVPEWVEQDLLPVNEYSRPGTPLETVNGIVVHYVGNPNTTAKQNRNYFANLAKTHETSASSHFVIGLDGEIIQCVPLNEISYCSNKRNVDTVAIECCHPDDTGKFTDATYSSLIKLLKWLSGEYGLTRDDIIRHYDVTGKICPKWYVDNPGDWEKLRDDVFAVE